MDFFDTLEGKKGCAVRHCRNARGKHNTGGFHRFCRRCRDRRYELENPVRYAYSNLKKSAKRRGHAFTITYEYFEKFCLDTNWLLYRGKDPENMTIDRKKSTLGYEPGNLQLLTNRENAFKNKHDRVLPQPGIEPASTEPW